ncbi:MAG: GNAT family N-acetyltransferase [Bacteroidota bacterium]
MSDQLTFKYLSFQELSLELLYQILALRQEVFVVEQNCPYLDADGNDQHSFHLVGFDENYKLVAYARVLPKGMTYKDYVSFGRVLSKGRNRSQGIGKALVKQLMREIDMQYGAIDLKISAQTYLIKFYEAFGFETVGEEYLEDDIPHVGMIYQGRNV